MTEVTLDGIIPEESCSMKFVDIVTHEPELKYDILTEALCRDLKSGVAKRIQCFTTYLMVCARKRTAVQRKLLDVCAGE